MFRFFRFAVSLSSIFVFICQLSEPHYSIGSGYSEGIRVLPPQRDRVEDISRKQVGMGTKKLTKLRFNCGVCTQPLSDANTLFTSCGHFFCFKPGKRCTSLIAGTPAGKCEQCGQDCDAGTLENKASRYDAQLKSTVFASLPDELGRISDIIVVSTTGISTLSFQPREVFDASSDTFSSCISFASGMKTSCATMPQRWL